MLVLIFIIFLAVYIYMTRKSVDKMIPSRQQREKQTEHLNQLRRDRIVGDFVLTAAVIPAMENDILPEEGFRVYTNEGYFKINGGSMIIASVSAEKMKYLFLSLSHEIGTVLSISVEDYHSDAQNIIDYLSYERDAYMLENIIDQYWRMIQNNYDVQVALFSAHVKVELVLTRVKTIHIHAVEPAPFVAILNDYGVVEKTNMRFFTESTYYVYNDYAGTDVFQRLISELGVHEKRYYVKQMLTR